jgi:hypothetical protein
MTATDVGERLTGVQTQHQGQHNHDYQREEHHSPHAHLHPPVPGSALASAYVVVALVAELLSSSC